MSTLINPPVKLERLAVNCRVQSVTGPFCCLTDCTSAQNPKPWDVQVSRAAFVVFPLFWHNLQALRVLGANCVTL